MRLRWPSGRQRLTGRSFRSWLLVGDPVAYSLRSIGRRDELPTGPCLWGHIRRPGPDRAFVYPIPAAREHPLNDRVELGTQAPRLGAGLFRWRVCGFKGRSLTKLAMCLTLHFVRGVN